MTKTNPIPATHKSTSKPLLPPRKQEYDYHWSRIFSLIAALLVLGGLSAYGLHLWFAASPQEGMDMAKTLPKAKVATDDKPLSLDEERIYQANEEGPASFPQVDKETLPALVGVDTEPTLVVEDTDSMPGTQDMVKPLLEEAAVEEDLSQADVADKLIETNLSSPELAPQSVDNLAGLETAGEVSAEPIYSVDSESAADAETSEELLAAPAEDELVQPQAEISEEVPMDSPTESPDSEEIKPAAETATGPFQLQELTILEPGVKRFLLTRTVSNKEPLGELSDVSFKADGNAAVWLFSEVVDMQGGQLNYVWLHEGNEVARVPVNVRGIRWRSYSSKNINQSMTGAWRVELHDGEGRLLASADFLL